MLEERVATMSNDDALKRGQECFSRQAWEEAYASLSAADGNVALDLDDLDRLAVSAYMSGRDEESKDAWTRLYREALPQGEGALAARSAFWLAFTLLSRGEAAGCNGWLSRGRQAIEGYEGECAEEGYLLIPVALQSMGGENPAAAFKLFEQAGTIGERFADLDLTTMGRLGRGQAAILDGRVSEGVALLDEAMVAVMAGEVSPPVVGVVYCAAIEACQWTFDVGRAKEWTQTLTQWCESQSGLVRYRGECLIHRAEMMQLQGEWRGAVDEARAACERLAGHPAAGAALYVEGDLHRLRGEFSQAEDAYRRANQWARTPQPGLALLRLAQGRVDAAVAAIRRVLEESHDRIARSRMLPACVEIELAMGDLPAARNAAEELCEIAAGFNAPFLDAASAHAKGAVLLREGETRGALVQLRRACEKWRELEAPYDAARSRVLIGQACRAMGDDDGAEMELDAAQSVFRQVGAAPELRRVEALLTKDRPRNVGGLTPREIEVLRLVAAGKTNRAIADELLLSEKTVARHMSNILGKLQLSSRAAATAFAYEHDLV